VHHGIAPSLLCGMWFRFPLMISTGSVPGVRQVTLVFLESDQIPASEVDRRGFAAVHIVPANATDAELLGLVPWLQQQAFHAVFFPQVGMHVSDLILANHRLAPVQVCSHPAV